MPGGVVTEAMPEISLTDAQLERLEQIQEDVADAFIDEYGRTRPEDALQYLLDTYLPPNEVEDVPEYVRLVRAGHSELKQAAAEVDVETEVDSVDELRGRLLATLGAEDAAAILEAIEEVNEETASVSAETTATSDPEGADESAETEAEESAPDSKNTAASTATTPVAEGSFGAINELLDEHDDKWRENDGEAPYEVDLPDGSAKPARTKDDIRQILFRKY
jgi:hypothetical protein